MDSLSVVSFYEGGGFCSVGTSVLDDILMCFGKITRRICLVLGPISKRKTDISLRLSENSCIFAKNIFRPMK